MKQRKPPTMAERQMICRNGLKGQNGQELMAFLEDEYLYQSSDDYDLNSHGQLAYFAGQRDLVLRLRQLSEAEPRDIKVEELEG